MHPPIQKAAAEFQRPQATYQRTGAFVFILKHGLFRSGVGMFVISTLYIYFVVRDRTAFEPARLLAKALLCAFLGICWGAYQWMQANPSRQNQ